MSFRLEDLPRREGAVAIVTGANTGLGYETTRYFAQKGIHVVMACRSAERAEAARERLASEIDGARLEVMPLDLSRLASVRAFAEAFRAKHDALDLLVNNAGIMWTPYARTEDGLEGQMAANYWGHFLLTALLIDRMPDRPESRIVVLSSNAHRMGPKRIRFEDIHWERDYHRVNAYSQTNLARVLFMRELSERLGAAGRQLRVVAAHPGMSETELVRQMKPWQVALIRYTIGPFLSHPPDEGALPQVMAALDPDAQSGEYFGPQGFQEMAGPPGRARIHPCGRDAEAAARLWTLSEELTGARFDLAPAAAQRASA